MRNKRTNFLQVAVLITGLVYIVVGVMFFISPEFFGRLISLNLIEDWSKQIKDDHSLVMLHLSARTLSGLLFVTGASMVLPLFEPLKYRGLVYAHGVFFPGISILLLIYNAIDIDYDKVFYAAGAFGIIFALCLISVVITKGDAKHGVE